MKYEESKKYLTFLGINDDEHTFLYGKKIRVATFLFFLEMMLKKCVTLYQALLPKKKQ